MLKFSCLTNFAQSLIIVVLRMFVSSFRYWWRSVLHIYIFNTYFNINSVKILKIYHLLVWFCNFCLEFLIFLSLFDFFNLILFSNLFNFFADFFCFSISFMSLVCFLLFFTNLFAFFFIFLFYLLFVKLISSIIVLISSKTLELFQFLSCS